MEHRNQTGEVKRALQEKVLLDDGRLGFVFSELVQIGPSNRWHCHVCSRTVDSERALVMHLSHPLHTTRLRSHKHPAKNFKKFADADEGLSKRSKLSPKLEGSHSPWEITATDVLPGEPVPPGMEDVVEGVCQIQTTFDEHPGPLIGLEYIVELVSEDESEPRYICLLCEKKGDPRSLMVHVTSQKHCLKYISCFFRTAGNALNMIPRTMENRKGIGIAILKIAQEIEKNYGRLKPTSVVAETFAIKKFEILRQIDEKEHFRETPNTTFANFVTPEKINEYSLQDDEFETISNAGPKANVIINPASVSSSKVADKPAPKPALEKPIVIDSDPIEVTSSISSISSSLCSDDEAKPNEPRRSNSRDRYLRKRRLTPELDDRRKYQSYRKGSPSRHLPRGPRSRSRSRDRDHYRRYTSDYYRERDRLRRSPSYGRGRGRPRFEDRIPEDKYRNRTPERIRYEREHDRKRRGDSRGRSDRDRSYERRDKPLEKKKESDIKWDKYRAELHKLELVFDSKLKHYEERPEKHPKYSEEWKSFWNKRYKEIQLTGKDPNSYDFKPEWIVYWAKRMKELSDEEFNKERDSLKKKMNVEDKPEKPPCSDLQDISPPTPESLKDVTVNDIKNTWKALTGTEISAPTIQEKITKRSPSPWESSSLPAQSGLAPPAADSERLSISTRKPYDIAPPVLHCLRMLSVLEGQLGSLGPKVMDLLGRALVLERTKYNSSMTLLKDVEIHIFFETVKEKIRGTLIAGVVQRNLVSSSRAVIKAIETMLDSNPPAQHPASTLPTLRAPAPLPVPRCEPVQVPGIGMIDKIAVAQQIASALVAQGRTDVAQEELEDLINAVVGIAKASNANVSKNLSSAAFFSQLNIENSTANSHINEILSNMISSAQKSLGIEKKPVETVINPQPVQPVVADKTVPTFSSLSEIIPNDIAKLSKRPSEELASVSAPTNSTGTISKITEVTDEELKEKLMKFSMLSRDEQQRLISLLKELEITQAARVENLRKYVSIGLVQNSSNKTKESKQGRLSPFSSRVGGTNPTPDDPQKSKQRITSPLSRKLYYNDDDDEDDDDDYSVEDVYKAASEKLFKKNESIQTNSENGNAATTEIPPNNNKQGQSYGLSSTTSSAKSSSSLSESCSSNRAAASLFSMLAGQPGSLLPNSNIMEILGNNEAFQLNLGNLLASQKESANATYSSSSSSNVNSALRSTPQSGTADSYYADNTERTNNFSENKFDFNTGNSSYTSQMAPPPFFDDPQSKLFNPSWQFSDGSADSSKSDNSFQHVNRNPPQQQSYFRAGPQSQSQQPPFGGYRPKF